MSHEASTHTSGRAAIAAVRTMHGLITAFFLTCMALVFYGGVSGEWLLLAWAAAGALVVEGVVVTLNGGDCPLGQVHHRLGDDKAFFELLLPRRAAKLAVPVLGVVAATGMLLLLLRSVS